MPKTENQAQYEDIKFEVPADVAEKVHALAERRGVTVSDLIMAALTEYVPPNV